ncbi:EAL domain-containing protein [Roseomonas sp. NAR14]|uniref:EAL domain-containing protein n=1 Tax=Roseomonas acroporae TaxID=2937791 RepID=A0A9X2BYY2_9PROT|nr:EAL domain-containing protein [Roseomonas acroporae]MCK8786480.1 EAL domain-containing protein [Roseomonas acroporae]
MPKRGNADPSSTEWPVAMAFQPIVDTGHDGAIFAYEALVRGPEGQAAGSVLSGIHLSNRSAFDHACKVSAIRSAGALGLAATGAALSINCLPGSVPMRDGFLETMLGAAEKAGVPAHSIVVEITESERIDDRAALRRHVRTWHEYGMRVAIDDFGAGHAGLGLLADFQPDFLKLDMGLIRGVDTDRARRVIVGGVVDICAELDVVVIAEGTETVGEYRALRDLGVTLFQGFLFARPEVGALPTVTLPS